MTVSRDCWNRCPGIPNPADMPSWGLDAHKLVSSNIRWEGPPFPKMSEHLWTKQEEARSNDLALTELTKTSHQKTHVLAVISEHVVNLMNVIDCEKFSNFKFLLQVTACFLESNKKNPVLLPSKHPSVKMLVTDAHHNTKHGGVNDTLVALRCRYWMLKGRQIVKSIVRSCARNLKDFLIVLNFPLIYQPAESQMTPHSPILDWILQAQYTVESQGMQVIILKVTLAYSLVHLLVLYT